MNYKDILEMINDNTLRLITKKENVNEEINLITNISYNIYNDDNMVDLYRKRWINIGAKGTNIHWLKGGVPPFS